MKIRRLPQAIRDVDDIWLYIAEHDPIAATRMVDRLITQVARLADFPNSGRARPEIGMDARGIVVGKYLVLYRVTSEAVEIVRVIHGARDLSGALEGLD